jgi:signal transduction histidine kinase
VMPSPISTEGIIGIAIAVVVIISCFITCIIIVIIIIVIWIKKSKACTGSKRGKYDVTNGNTVCNQKVHIKPEITSYVGIVKLKSCCFNYLKVPIKNLVTIIHCCSVK